MDSHRIERAMKPRLILLTSMLIGLMQPLHSQVVLPQRESGGGLPEHAFGLGVSLGAASGIGLSFRHHFPSTISYQLTGGIINVDDRMQYSFGAEVQADLSRTYTARFFAAGAVGYYHAGKSGKNEMAGPGRVGVGIGGETYLGGGFHGSLELLFTYFTDGTVLPLPQCAFHYYF